MQAYLHPAEILTIRKGLWTAVSSRQHTIIKIFPFGSGSNELMLYGTVAYTLKDGKKADVSFVFVFCVLALRVQTREMRNSG